MPTPDPPHKPGAKAPFKDRVEMLRLAFSGMDGVTVSDLENRLKFPSYTLQTVKVLQQNDPDTRFYLCIGEDSLASFHEWHRYDELLKRVPLLVAERPGTDSRNIAPDILEKVIFVEHQPVDLSSSKIRKSRSGRQVPELPEEVKTYIQTHQLYDFGDTA